MPAQVGAFPGMLFDKRRTIRSPVNPLDKSTVVSIYPRDIIEVKPTIQPGRFVIPAGSLSKPQLLVVSPSSWWKETGPDEPLLEITNGSIQVAESIVRDYCIGIFCCDMHSAMPGLFWIPGEVTSQELKLKYAKELKRAEEKQKNYYEALIKMADSLWARTNGNPLVISDDMRLAAAELGVEGKDWMNNFTAQDMSRCPACGSFRNELYPVCPHCKVIVDVEKATKMGIKFSA